VCSFRIGLAGLETVIVAMAAVVRQQSSTGFQGLSQSGETAAAETRVGARGSG